MFGNHAAYFITDLFFGGFQFYNLSGTVKLFKFCDVGGKRIPGGHVQGTGNDQCTITLNIQLAAVNIPKKIFGK